MNINKIPPIPEDDSYDDSPEVEDLEREMAEEHKRIQKKVVKILALGVIFMVTLAGFAVYSYGKTNPVVDGYTKICDVGGGTSVWKPEDATDDAGLLLRSPNADYKSWDLLSGEDKFEDKKMEPSKWFSGYYFFPNGKPLEVVKDEDGFFCIKLAEYAACGFKELSSIVFDANEMVECGESQENVHIYLIKDFLVSGRFIQDVKRTRDMKLFHRGPMFTPSLGNDKLVLHRADEFVGKLYAEIINLHFVDKKSVFIGRRVIDRKSGTPEVETSTYDFVWGDRKFKIDCNALRVPLKPIKDEDEFEQIVKPFPANICTRDLEIGLDRRLELYTRRGKAVKKRTLYFTVEGERFPATERKEK